MSGRISHSIRGVSCAVFVVAGIAGATSGAYAEPAPGNMGGGFIEMLMTGQTPTARRQGAPQYQTPAQPGYFARSSAPVAYPQPGVRPRGTRAMYQAPPEPEMPRAQRTAHTSLSDPYAQGVIVPGRGPQQERTAAPMQSSFDPRFEKQEVPYAGPQAAGTLVIDTPNRYLYLVQGNGRALRYGIGVGRPGFEWAGAKTISMKREWPDWRPPAEMLKRRPDLPTYMAGGVENPLGARAMYLGSSLYRIHGTNEPETIGRAVSSGCIRMRNEDVVDLYGRVKVGTKVVVM